MVDGVIVEGGLDDEGARLLASKGYPVVIGYTDSGIPCVHPDDEGGAYTLTQHLLALGHRRVGMSRFALPTGCPLFYSKYQSRLARVEWMGVA